MVGEDKSGGEESMESNSKRPKSRSSPAPSDWLMNIHKDLVAGAVMGGIVQTIVAPIEKAKLLLQTQESNTAIVAGRHRRFRGMFDFILSNLDGKMTREFGQEKTNKRQLRWN